MKYILCLAAMLFTWHVSAKRVKGVVTINNEDKEVYLEIPYVKDEPDMSKAFKSIEVYDEINRRVPHFYTDISKFQFEDEKYGVVKMVSLSKKTHGVAGSGFYHLVQDGNVKLYHAIKVATYSGYGDVPKRYIYVYSKEIGFLKVNDSTFKKKMLKTFSGECPKLKEKLTYRFNELTDMARIVRFLNGCL